MNWSTVLKDPLITLFGYDDGNRHKSPNNLILVYVIQLSHSAALHVLTTKT